MRRRQRQRGDPEWPLFLLDHLLVLLGTPRLRMGQGHPGTAAAAAAPAPQEQEEVEVEVEWKASLAQSLEKALPGASQSRASRAVQRSLRERQEEEEE